MKRTLIFGSFRDSHKSVTVRTPARDIRTAEAREHWERVQARRPVIKQNLRRVS